MKWLTANWLTAKRAQVILLFLVLVVGGGNLLATRAQVHHQAAVQAADHAAHIRLYHREQAEQAKQGQRVVMLICTTMGKLAALKPPAGNAAANPSRAYEQELHATLDQLGPDLGCVSPS